MTSAPHFGVHPGEVLAGKYRVERVLGVGGMGVVVAAEHLQLGERVALKFLLPQALANPEVVARFDREARAAVRIKSEHVARVIDVGRLESGAPYMVMEYLEGGDLAAWLDHRGPMAVDQAVEFVLQACEAIAEAHALGIVHRDLKPANLFCIRRPDGLLSIKVLDFGISKTSGMGSSADMGMTRSAAIVGSPFYMSPEQMHSAKGVDARTDIWSLGVILFELLTDRVPFQADAVPELVLRVLHDAPPSLTALRADIPPRLEAVVLRCLEKDRALRYASIAELVHDLAEFAPPRARHSLDVVSGIAFSTARPRVAFSVEAPAATRIAVVPAVTPARLPTAASWGATGASRTNAPKKSHAGALALVAGVGALAVLSVAAVAVGPSLLHPHPAVDAAPLVLDVAEHPGDAAVVPVLVREDAATDAALDAIPALDAARPPVFAVIPVRHDAGRAYVFDPPPAATPQPPDCRTPYFYDAQGNKVFKVGCL